MSLNRSQSETGFSVNDLIDEMRVTLTTTNGIKNTNFVTREFIEEKEKFVTNLINNYYKNPTPYTRPVFFIRPFHHMHDIFDTHPHLQNGSALFEEGPQSSIVDAFPDTIKLFWDELFKIFLSSKEDITEDLFKEIYKKYFGHLFTEGSYDGSANFITTLTIKKNFSFFRIIEDNIFEEEPDEYRFNIQPTPLIHQYKPITIPASISLEMLFMGFENDYISCGSDVEVFQKFYQTYIYSDPINALPRNEQINYLKSTGSLFITSL